MIKAIILLATTLIPILSSDIKTSLQNIVQLVSEPVLLLETQRSHIENLKNIIAYNNKTLSKRKLELLKNAVDLEWSVFYWIKPRIFGQLRASYFELKRNKMEYMKANEDTEHYFNNAINRAILIKGLLTDIDFIKGHGIGWRKNVSLRYPEYKDLEVSVCALAGLQRFYLLNVTQLAEGVLNTSYSVNGETYIEFFSPMTASDCLVIGKAMYKSRLFKEGIPWILEALRLYNKTKPHNFNMADVVTAICKGYDVLGYHKKYIRWAKKLLDLKHQHNKELEYNINIHNKLLQKSLVDREQQIQRSKKKEKIKLISDSSDLFRKNEETEIFRKLCRGELCVNSEISRKLKCWYSVGQHPFSILAPFKAEQLFIQPDLVLVHNMLSNDEIYTITKLASSNYVIKGELLYEKPIVYPLVKITALEDSQLKSITRRVSHFTGLRIKDSNWTVSKYSVGGHYKIHIDSKAYDPYESSALKYYNLTCCPLRKVDDDNLKRVFAKHKMYCRITTVLIYLSDVEQGGATVFPVLGVAVYPKRGAALFWNNLLPSGEKDLTLHHGACPVLHGSKTIAQKWISYENQVLTCPLKEIRITKNN